MLTGVIDSAGKIEIELALIKNFEEKDQTTRDDRIYFTPILTEQDLKSLPGAARISKYDSHSSEKNAIPIKLITNLLDVLRTKLTEDAEYYYMRKVHYHNFLREVFDKGYLTKRQFSFYQDFMPVVNIIKEFELTAQETKDANLAFEISVYHKEQKKMGQSLLWLLHAKAFDPYHPFFRVSDNVQRFLKEAAPFGSLKIPYLFGYPNPMWLLDEIANCSSITTLNLNGISADYLDEGFYHFLNRARYVTLLDLGNSWAASDKMNANDVKRLAHALATNRSLENLVLNEQRINDKGLIAILAALKKNPHSKLRGLVLYNCGITEKGASALLNYLETDTVLQYINLSSNSDITRATLRNIDNILAAKSAPSAEALPLKHPLGQLEKLLSSGLTLVAGVAPHLAIAHEQSAALSLPRGDYDNSIAAKVGLGLAALGLASLTLYGIFTCLRRNGARNPLLPVERPPKRKFPTA